MAQLPDQQGFPLNHQPVVMEPLLVPCVMGCLIFACGCFQLHMCDGSYDDKWELLDGVFAIITGFFGLASAGNKCVANTFMVFDFITTLLCALCGFQTINHSQRVSFGMQFLFCIIGATFHVWNSLV
ncbi:uncharacterized protein [Apostichopus japonicus]|uniref:uncharacterized protein n=1 Tax=Stichopus japonicus TaxID=307972 RepID=UPI003AB21C0D